MAQLFSKLKLVEVCLHSFHSAPAGNRTSHYRKPIVGVTLVHFLGNRVPPALARFQARVEEALPGMYDWFKPESLHVTVRALT